MGVWILLALAVFLVLAVYRASRAKPVGAMLPSSDLPVQQGGRTFRIAVHGESHRNDDGTSRQAILRHCSAGESIMLIPQPDNPFDHLAVRVCRASGEQIGFLPEGHGLNKKIQQGLISAILDGVHGGTPDKPSRGAVLLITEHG